jgi:hypothetical protein
MWGATPLIKTSPEGLNLGLVKRCWARCDHTRENASGAPSALPG